MRYILFSVILLAACGQQEKAGTERYPDLPGLMANEITLLDSINAGLSKYQVLDDDSSNIALSEVDWAKELEIFSSLDMNKPAWLGYYSADTSFTNATEGHFDKIAFSATKESIPLRTVSVHYLRNTDVPYRIEAYFEESNFLYDVSRDFDISLGNSFFVHTKQKTLFLKPVNVKVKGTVVYPEED